MALVSIVLVAFVVAITVTWWAGVVLGVVGLVTVMPVLRRRNDVEPAADPSGAHDLDGGPT